MAHSEEGPADPADAIRRAEALLLAGEAGPAAALLDAARRRFPDNPLVLARLGDAAQMAGNLSEAVATYQAALQRDETNAEAWYGLGCAQLAQRAYGAAATALGRAVALQPGAAGARYNLGRSLFELGEVDAAARCFRRAADDPTTSDLALRSLACIIPGVGDADHAAILRARRAWADRLPSQGPHPPTRARAAPAGGRIRIGYLSAFFGARNWMKPVWGLINHHDRGRFEIHMFSDGAMPSADSGYRDWEDDYVHDIRGIPNSRAAEIIADAGMDILVDLNGYSAQDRLCMLQLRPAPTIVCWFNMYATSGLGAADWLVGDAEVVRPDEEPHYRERIHRLPGTCLAFEVGYPVPDVSGPPSLASGRPGPLTFGSLGSLYKLTDDVVAAWARILREVPAATLLLGNAPLSDPSTRDALSDRFARLGIDPASLILCGRAEHYDFLRLYDRIDIALDTFPYNGGTTTSEALWQGVPVLAFGGDRWAARTSRSLLLAAGLSDWVADDQEAYVRRAVALALDPATPERLAVLRAGMRARLRVAPVCDTAGLCRAMERFYETIARPG
jgi:protein O-GlcNAc transferase